MVRGASIVWKINQYTELDKGSASNKKAHMAFALGRPAVRSATWLVTMAP
jgi:hypothetical protein